MRAAVWVFALCFIAQAFAPREVAAASVWGFAPGWQREIAFFDLTIAVLAFSALRMDDARFGRSVTLAIVVLMALVGTNHLATVRFGTSSWLHEIFIGVNYAGVALGGAALFASRPARS